MRMKSIIREISKLCMFVVAWALPLLLARWNENNLFLWLFVLSLIITVGIFSHYEILEELDRKDSSDGSNE